MKHNGFPTPAVLLRIWALLIALTLGTMLAGQVTGNAAIGVWWMAALMAVTFFKARLILRYYLDLKSASAGWSGVFSGTVFTVLAIVFGLYLL